MERPGSTGDHYYGCWPGGQTQAGSALEMARCKPGWQIVLLLLTMLLLGTIRSASAQGSERHAGLVLQFADGSTKSYCVAFAEDSISGLDLLLKTGLDVRVESFGGAGALICKIGPDGCDFPEQAVSASPTGQAVFTGAIII